MRLVNALVCCVAIGSVSCQALAQEAGRPPRQGQGNRQPGGEGGRQAPREAMSPEAAKSAWAIQATAVAKRLGFDATQTDMLVKAYADARESQRAAADAVRKQAREQMQERRGQPGGEGGRPPEGGGPEGGERPRRERGAAGGAMQAMEEANKVEREKFVKALGDAGLGSEETRKAVASLGLFSPVWDGMANAIAGFNLDEAKQQQALEAVETFVVTSAGVRGGAPEDREKARETMTAARTKLNDTLKGVLSEDQMKKFEQLTARGMGGMGGAGGRGQRPDRGGPQGPRGGEPGEPR